MMHGAIYGVMKTEGELQNKLRGWVNNTIIFFIICYITTTMATLIYYPHMIEHFKEFPALFILAVLNMLAIANIPREISKGKEFLHFFPHVLQLRHYFFYLQLGYFPILYLASNNPEYSLNIYNAASSQKTLNIMLIIA